MQRCIENINGKWTTIEKKIPNPDTKMIYLEGKGKNEKSKAKILSFPIKQIALQLTGNGLFSLSKPWVPAFTEILLEIPLILPKGSWVGED